MKRRILSIITALALCWSLCPTWAFAFEGEPDTGLCAHHTEHTDACGYIAPSEGQPCGHAHTDDCYITGEDGSEVLDCQHTHDSECGYIQATPGASCGYECKLCPIEALIAALPRALTEDNAETVRWQLDEILDLWRELDEDEQEQIDLSPCWDLQAALDPANEPMTVDETTEGDVARVEMPDGTTTYVSALADAFAAGNSGAKITLLADVDIGETTLNVLRDTNFTLDCGNFTLSGSNTCLEVKSGGALTFVGGTVRNTGWSGCTVNVLGTFTMSGGVLDSTSSYVLVVNNSNNVHVTVTGGTVGVSDIGLNVYDNSKATIALSGGTYSSINPGREGTYGNYTYYPVSSVLAPGYALKGADGFIRGDATGMQKTVTVVECTHDGAATPNEDGATHGGDCPYCGTKFEAAPHTLGADNKCEGCKTPLVASVKIGDATTYYGTIFDTWAAATAGGVTSAKVTLLADVTETLFLSVTDGDEITLNGGSNTLSIQGFSVAGGQLDITGGMFEMDGGLNVSGGTVHLSGGIFRIGSNGGIGCSSGVASLLSNYGTENTPHYAYFDEAGKPIALTEGQTSLTGTVKVQECHHEGVTPTPNNDGTHSINCPYCGYTGTAEDCSYGTEYQHNDTDHWKTCPVCQGTTTPEAHYLRVTADEPVNGVTQNREACDYCDFTKNPFTVTVIVPSSLTYGNTVGIKPSYTVSTEKIFDVVELVLEDGEGNVKYVTGDTLPDDLSAGNYKLHLKGIVSGNPLPVFVGRVYFTVDPASLNGNMVTLSPENATYNGTEQKPAITVKQGDDALAEGTDYDVTYSTTDFTNAGTVKITVTGKGNYKGTVEENYTIAQAALTITASDQTITYGESIAQGIGEVDATGLCSGDNLDGITLDPSTDNVPGGTIRPSAASVKNGSGQDMTGNYDVSYVDGALTINQSTPTIAFVSGYAPNKTYDGQTIANPAASNLVITGARYDDVKFEWSGTPLDAGTYTLTATIPETTNTAKAEAALTVTISPKTVTADSSNITLTPSVYEFDGTAREPAVVIKDGTLTIPAGEYSVDYSNNVNVGQATVTITDKDGGNYTVNGSTTFEITKRSLGNATVTVSGTYTYDGEAQIPTAGNVSVALNGVTIDPSEYSMSVTSNINAGVATVTITANPDGDYSGNASGTFTITQAPLTITANKQTIAYGGSIETNVGNVTYTALCSGDTLQSITLTANAKDVPGGKIIPSAASILNGSSEDVSRNYEITYVNGDLTINKADQAAPAAPSAADANIKDTSITLDTIANAEYSKDGTNWQASPEFTGLNSNHAYTFYARLKEDNNHNPSPASTAASITTKKTMLDNAVVTVNGSYTYTGEAQVPTAAQVKVTLNGTEISSDQYTISAANNINAGDATVTITATANGDYSGSASGKFTISQALLTIKAKDQTITYGQSITQGTGQVTVTTLCGSDKLESIVLTASSDQVVVKDKTITPSAASIKYSGSQDVTGNYKITYEKGSLTINKDTSATPPAAGEGYTISYPQETITVKAGYEVSTANDGSGTPVASGSISAHLGTTLYIRKVEDDNHAASGWTAFTLAARPAAPSLTKTDETLKGQKDGSLTVETAGTEYSTDGGTTWVEYTGELTGLAGNTSIQVRVKATDAKPHGEASSCNISEGETITVTFDSKGGSSVAAQTGLSYGDKATKPQDPTLEDHEFQGWYKDEGYTTAWNFDSDTLTAKNGTLYAKWLKVRFEVGGKVYANDGKTPVDGAKVVLMQGSEQIGIGSTASDGKFTFNEHILAGTYNIVTTYTPAGGKQQIKTTLITIEDADISNVEVKLPPEGVNSQLTVKADSDTPAVVVGGLDDEAAELKDIENASTVTVSMEVEGQKEAEVKPKVVTAIKEEAKKEAASTSDPVVEYLDISVTKQINSGKKEEITNTNQVIEIVVPFTFGGRDNIVVVRYHVDKAEPLGKLNDKPSRNYQDGTFYLDTAGGYIHIYTRKFSTYAVAYTASYTITFDPNEGEVTSTTVSTKSDGTLESLPTPTRSGYTFSGWYTQTSGGSKVTTSTVFKADATVYAQWRKNSSPPSGPSGPSYDPGWIGVSTYAVTVEKSEHGKVTTGSVNAASGSTVTLTVTPDSGYVLSTLTVTDSRGDEIKLTAQGNGKYTFTMPSRAVTVKAVFAPLMDNTGAPCDGGANCPSRYFSDLGSVGTWYHEAVDFVLRNGLMNGHGNGLFAPNQNLSRAQLAQILFNKDGRPVVNYLMQYNDVPSGAWYTEAVRWATSQGIVGGYGNGLFGPDDNITREQLAVMLWRYAGNPAATDRELHFADAYRASDWALEALRWASENKIVNGKGDGILDPTGQATRAETAQMLANFMNREGEGSK